MPGQLLVQAKDMVVPNQVIAVIRRQSEDQWLIPAARQLGVHPSQLPRFLVVRPPASVQPGQVLARREVDLASPIECIAPAAGELKGPDGDGRLILRESPPAWRRTFNISLADSLHCRPRQLTRLLWRRVGDRLQRGEIIAGSYPGPVLTAPITAQIIDFQPRTGDLVLLPTADSLQVRAMVAGQVTLTEPRFSVRIACLGWALSCRFWFGGPASGKITLLPPGARRVVNPKLIPADLSGRVLLLEGCLTADVYLRAAAARVAGIIAAGADLCELQWVANHFGDGDLHLPPHGPAVLLRFGLGQQRLDQEEAGWWRARVGSWAFLSGQPGYRPGQILVFPE